MAKIIKKSIELSEPLLARAIGLTRLRPTTEFDAAFEVQGTLKEHEKTLLHEVRIDLVDNADAWNEEEL